MLPHNSPPLHHDPHVSYDYEGIKSELVDPSSHNIFLTRSDVYRPGVAFFHRGRSKYVVGGWATFAILSIMKRSFYIAAFGFFGLLVATLVHAGVEIVALQIIFGNPEQFSDTFWWQSWQVIHDSVSATLWIIGLAVGLYLGKIWWEPYGKQPGLYHWRGKR